MTDKKWESINSTLNDIGGMQHLTAETKKWVMGKAIEKLKGKRGTCYGCRNNKLFNVRGLCNCFRFWCKDCRNKKNGFYDGKNWRCYECLVEEL